MLDLVQRTRRHYVGRAEAKLHLIEGRDSAIADADLRADLGECLGRLPEPQARLLRDRYLRHMSLAALAEREETDRGTISRHLGKAADAARYKGRHRGKR
jgi:DNA-directed RNA polymerase specialized sigma24 family protein